MIASETTTHNAYCESAIETIHIEAETVLALKKSIDVCFANACEAILNCKGRVIVSGMGKSGHIAGKIAATLASTGTPAFYLHPGEANHGDIGMITPSDILITISNSGETPEILAIIPIAHRIGAKLIAMTGNKNSRLARAAEITLHVPVEKEACPLGLAPTSTTTATLVMGDALAVALLKARGFTQDDFALFHPGGSIGRRLLLQIQSLMHIGDAVPVIKPDENIHRALMEMTSKSLGMTAIADDNNKLLGIFTDGDLRRTLDQRFDLNNTPISQAMTKNPITTYPETLATQALNMMEKYKITSLVVVDSDNTIVGVIHMHDLLRAGLL